MKLQTRLSLLLAAALFLQAFPATQAAAQEDVSSAVQTVQEDVLLAAQTAQEDVLPLAPAEQERRLSSVGEEEDCLFPVEEEQEDCLSPVEEEQEGYLPPASEGEEPALDGEEGASTEEGTAPTPAVGEAEYRVSFDANGGTGTVPAAVLLQEGESIRLPNVTLVSAYADQFFVGWSPERNAAAPSWITGDLVAPDRDMVLYAVYLPETVTVLYHVGEVTMEESLSPGGTPRHVPPLSEEFTGWCDEEGLPVDPGSLIVWGPRTFTAAAFQTTPNPFDDNPPDNPPDDNPPEPPVTQTWRLRQDHVQIMAGYGDSLFYPERQMTRAQAAKILYGLLENPAQERALFPDMTGGEWYAGEVGGLNSMGLLRAREDGAFQGDAPITRAEFADILSRVIPAAEDSAGMEEAAWLESGKSFPDVPADYWAYRAIQRVAAAGLFAGDGEGRFRPDGLLTRAQAAVVFNRLLGRVPDGEVIRNSPNLRLFPDVPVDYWAYEQIMEACVPHTCMPNGEGGETWTSITAGQSPVEDGYYSINGYLYRMYYGLYVRNKTVDGYTYDASGRYTTGNQELDGYLSKIIREKTDSSMTRDQKLRTLYLYLRDNFTYLARPHIEKGQTGWEDGYALAFFQKSRGNCFSFAAGFYELSRALGVSSKAIVGWVGKSRQDHGWVEVYTDGKTWIYDPELEMAYRRRGDYRWNLCKITYAASPFSYYK